MIRTFPYLEIKGSNYEVGRAIGEMFRGKIQETIIDRKHYIRNYIQKIEQTYPFYRLTKLAFPQYLEELQGMADGADIPMQDLFFHNNSEVYDHSLNWDREQTLAVDHCTSVVSFGENDVVIGHNEDWSINSLDELYVLKATIGDTTILGLNYATFLIGQSVMMNNWGLVQCINDLQQNNRVGIPKFFAARHCIVSKTLEEAVSSLQNISHASGYNHVLVQGREVRDVEVTQSNIDVEIIREKPYVHTNHHLSKHTKPEEMFASRSSLARYERARQLTRNKMSRDHMIALLSDKENSAYPICRENITIGSVVIELKKMTMYICYGSPSTGTFIPYKL